MDTTLHVNVSCSSLNQKNTEYITNKSKTTFIAVLTQTEMDRKLILTPSKLTHNNNNQSINQSINQSDVDDSHTYIY